MLLLLVYSFFFLLLVVRFVTFEFLFFFFKQKTAYEMRISDWSSDVCSSDLEREGLVRFAFRHQVDEILMEGSGKDRAAVGVRGSVLEASDAERGVKSSREVVGDFEHRAPAVVVTSGGIGHNFDLMRQNWPVDRLGPVPKHLIAGVPAHVDGRMLEISATAGAQLVNSDRMWAYTEWSHNGDPIWPDNAVRCIPGPSLMWFDALGNRLPARNFPGFDSIGTMKAILATGHDYSWFILTQKIIEKEFALSGSEQNPDITSRDLKFMLQSRLAKGAPAQVEKLKAHGEECVVSSTIEPRGRGMKQGR